MVEIGNNLQRIRELSVQAANGTNSADDRASLNAEVEQLADEIDRVVQNTTFNGTNLLGSAQTISIQVGAGAATHDKIDISLVDISAVATAVSGLDISDVAGADAAITAIDTQLDTVNSARADLGAIQNRFTSVVANLQTSSENLSASRSRIRVVSALVAPPSAPQAARITAVEAARSRSTLAKKPGSSFIAGSPAAGWR